MANPISQHRQVQISCLGESPSPLLMPLTAPSLGRRDVGFLWVPTPLWRAPPHALSTHLLSIAFEGVGFNIRTTGTHRHSDSSMEVRRLGDRSVRADWFTC